MPLARNQAKWCSTMGLPLTSTIGLGLSCVSGQRRSPLPPASTSAVVGWACAITRVVYRAAERRVNASPAALSAA